MISNPRRASPAPVLRLLDAHAPIAKETWCALQQQASPPYFLTWGWIRNWLACLPLRDAPRLATLFVGDVPVAAFFLGRRRLFRHFFVPSRALFLNTTGRARWDELTVEHNALLCAPDACLSLDALLDLLPADWDELFLPALSRASFPGSALDAPLPGHVVLIDSECSSPYVDLAKVRAAAGGYVSLLSSRTRAQIRRAQRGFGTLRLEAAADVRRALEIYDELVELHTRTWRSRGMPGAFADPWFDGFHRRLIGERFEHGEIQLLRLSAGSATIGCLYNLIATGRVLYYQSGLASFGDPHLKPGYVCHAEAVRHNAAAGHAVYDLLAGDSRYKRSLATDEVRLVWARIQRPLARFQVERRLRRWKRRWP